MTVITKGGEDILNNTYGFEIEFCSHDSSVFAFTHVDTAEIRITPQEGEAAFWKIETDSGNVLELVSPPLRFERIAQAYAFKEQLAAALTQSVEVSGTYGEWYGRNQAALQELFNGYYGACEMAFSFRSIDEVGPQINVENVDDGINIQGALVRLNRNVDDWGNYVGATVVAWSEKDWAIGYSSQVNLPMTVEGYFLYSLQRKLPKSQERFAQMVEHPDQPGLLQLSVEKLEQRLFTWFWRNIEFTVFAQYALSLYGADALGEIHGLLPDEHAPFIADLGSLQMEEEDLKVSRETYEAVTSVMRRIYEAPRRNCDPARIKTLAILYVTVSKMLSGALGSLSERNQLALQNVAWENGSTEGMAPPIIQPEEVMAQRRWLEYHSSMKDLTGLWFKGALLDVVSKEQQFVRLPDNGLRVWTAVIGTYVSIMNAERWDTGRIYTDDLSGLHFEELSGRIAEIEHAYNEYLHTLHDGIPAFNLPPRNERVFLHYGELPNSQWEGRYDTMIPSIAPHGEVQYTYLIEHRFN